MQMRMENTDALTSQQISEFLKGNEGLQFTDQKRSEVYRTIERILVAQQYFKQSKKERGAIRHYLSKVTGLSLPQVTRLIRSYKRTGKVEAKPYRRRRF